MFGFKSRNKDPEVSFRAPEISEKYNRYKERLKPDECSLCGAQRRGDHVVVEETDHTLVIENMFPYDKWNQRRVMDHLLFLPKRHIKSLTEFSPEEKQDFMNVLSKYEVRGYNYYGRATNDIDRSVAHIHIHLLKIKH